MKIFENEIVEKYFTKSQAKATYSIKFRDLLIFLFFSPLSFNFTSTIYQISVCDKSNHEENIKMLLIRKYI